MEKTLIFLLPQEEQQVSNNYNFRSQDNKCIMEDFYVKGTKCSKELITLTLSCFTYAHQYFM